MIFGDQGCASKRAVGALQEKPGARFEISANLKIQIIFYNVFV